jgi:filamentous hemagglutinin family protein
MNLKNSPICNLRCFAAAIDFDDGIFMQFFNIRRNAVLCCIGIGAMIFGPAANVSANPTGMTVESGSASVHQSGSQLTVTASQNAFLNWQSFNIAPGETTIFNQPSASSIVWNRINDPNPSQIFGNLQANGVVVLLNSSGFYFGPNSFVSAAGLVVSTAQCAPPENGGGGWKFNGPPPLASIVNYGKISVGQSGSAFLIADRIENHGTIEAPDGTIGLADGQTVLLSERPDGRGMSLQVKLPQGSVDNYGNLIADAGTIALNAKVINQDGLLQANSVRNQNGVIELVASDQLTLGANSVIQASGDNSSSGSAGGTVTLKSENDFGDNVGSKIVLTGGAQGGNGGNVEISAPNVLSLDSSINARSQPGWTAGKLLLDPDYIILDSSGSDIISSGTVLVGDYSGSTLDLNVNSAFANFAVSEIMLQAKYNITIADSTFWSLSDTIGANFGGITSGLLTLEAGGNIIFGNNAAIFDANGWSVSLKAGVSDFVAGTVQPAPANNPTISGNIYLDGANGQDGANGLSLGGSIQTTTGSIDLLAGQDIQVGSGSVTTVGGGSITAKAVAGSVNTGTDTGAFTFNNIAPLYAVDTSFPGTLGGISTAAGGDVNITAGQDIISYLPSGSINQGNTTPDAGSGAFGSGNVTLDAGRNVEGHFIVTAGAGVINAGNNAGVTTDVANTDGTSGRNLALSLIAGDGSSPGGWTVDAGQDILLQEVRNPNGIFNEAGSSRSSSYHLFDYAPDDYVTLAAGNSVQLTGNSVPRNSDESPIPIIYPPILDIAAGAGGVVLGQNVILFSSPQGSLNITTTGGGSLQSQAYLDYLANLTKYENGQLDQPPSFPGEVQLIVSDSSGPDDSGRKQYVFSGDPFGISDHAAVPTHLNNPTTVALNISGDMNNFELVSPEAAEINVVGDINNSSLIGQNLQPTDVTSINVGQTAKNNMELSGILNPATDSNLTVGGDILNAGEFNSIPVASAPDLALLNQAYDMSTGQLVPLTDLASRLHFSPDPTDPNMGTLIFQGQMSSDYKNDLMTLEVVDGYNPDGTPQTTPVHILSSTEADDLYQASLVAPISQNPGYFIGGGGQFNIMARNMNLGSTLGIQSVGPGNGSRDVGQNHALANYFSTGANINVTLAGNLDMFSTTIASIDAGNITVNAGGYVDVGSPYFTGDDSYVRGIFTVGPGNVDVTAGGDISLNGSRIAAYDGGNVMVESSNGNLDAGNGVTGSVSVNEIYVDPVTHLVYNYSPTIPGSGILATSFPPRNSLFPAPGYTVGNILIETPNGDINASHGGILQLPLNGINSAAATVTLLAGEDASGNIISPGRNINASGSGVIGGTVELKASGNINGLVIASGNINISAQQNVDVTALAQGTGDLSAGGTISGTIIGVGGISASGAGGITAALLSNNSISGATSGQSGLAQGTAANATSQAASNNDSNQTADKSTTSGDTDDLKKKSITLAQKVGRVTVLLPPKTLSENQNSRNPL